MDFLHFSGKKGELVVISSTLWLSQKLLGTGSPLLGLFSMHVMGLANCCDVLQSLDIDTPREKFETAVYLREPMLAHDFAPPIEKYLASYLYGNKIALKEIIGEVFSEEKRKISLIYEGILRAVASGKNKSGEISSFLFSRKLLPKDNPGAIQRHLDVLTRIGLLEKIETTGKKYYYDHVSPLFKLHFYLDEKYGYTEMDVPLGYIEDVIRKRLPIDVEKFTWDLLATSLGLKKIKIEKPEIDVALKKFQKIVLVGEVKWKKKITTSDLENTRKKLDHFDAKKVLIVPSKSKIPTIKGVEIIDPLDMIQLCLGKYSLLEKEAL